MEFGCKKDFTNLIFMLVKICFQAFTNLKKQFEKFQHFFCAAQVLWTKATCI